MFIDCSHAQLNGSNHVEGIEISHTLDVHRHTWCGPSVTPYLTRQSMWICLQLDQQQPEGHPKTLMNTVRALRSTEKESSKVRTLSFFIYVSFLHRQVLPGHR